MEDITFLSTFTDFFSYYPDIENEHFYQLLNHKSEFLTIPEDTEIKKVPMKHQQFVTTYLNVDTLYQSLLLFHEMGSGKTCAVINTIETIRKSKSTIKGAIILGRGQGILNNIKNELMFECTKGEWIPKNYDTLPPQTQTHRRQALLATYYSFHTFINFAKTIKKIRQSTTVETSKSIIRQRYSNYVFVIDEVHNITNKELAKTLRDEVDKTLDVYDEIYFLLHTITNAKIMLLTGTPMQDKPNEIASILNLILPETNQLVTDKAFDNKYIIGNELNPAFKNELLNHFKGYISYVQNIKTNVQITYMGRTMGKLSSFVVYPSIMSTEQTTAYLRINEQEDTFFTKSRYASLCIRPTGDDKWTHSDIDILKQNIRRFNRIDDRLTELNRWSCKYASIIRAIINAENKLCFVYLEYVAAPGIDLFCELLPLFSIDNHTSTSMNSKFIKLTGDTQHKQELINKFNDPLNYQGSIIKVIIGSEAISEGYSFQNIQEVHIVTPHWNFAETIQAISRAIRAQSHRVLLSHNIVPVISIYLHVALTPLKSIDLHMYEISENKDKNIKVFERLLKESAVDCVFNYTRNHPESSVPNSRDCDYINCDYKCITDSNTIIPIDVSNVSIASPIIEQRIRELFLQKFYYSFNEIIGYIPEFNQFQIMTILFRIISTDLEMDNKYGFKCRIREHNDYFYLIDSVFDTKSYISTFYVEFPTVHENITFQSIVDRNVVEQKQILIEKCFSKQSIYFLQQLDEDDQEHILEYCITNRTENQSIIDKTEFIYSHFTNYLMKIQNPLTNINYILSTFLFTDKNISTLRVFDIQHSSWVNGTVEILRPIIQPIVDKKQQYKINKTTYAIIMKQNPTISDFKIVRPQTKISQDARTINTGIQALFLSIPDINSLYTLFKLRPPTPSNKTNLLTRLLQYFMSNSDRYIYDNENDLSTLFTE